MTAYAIEVSAASKRFGETVAVRDVTLQIGRGEIFAIVGPDGAGKTTLLRLLCGALVPDGGSLRVDGVDVARRPQAVQSVIGYMPQRFSLYPDLSVRENLRFYGAIFDVPSREFEERAAQLLEDFALSAFASRLADQLSGGMKQKLALACALIHSPATILLDEPTAGVDPVSRRAFWRILSTVHANGTTILLTTAYMDEAERADRVAFMAHGSILSFGEPASLKTSMGGDVIEIAGVERAAARRALRAEESVRSIEIFGDTLHALVASADESLPRIRTRLSAAGLEQARLRRIQPSLEDAFVARLAS
ncbi:MAG TPA: ABC transporter ATP-binding protein [Candidatus Baltobacteraceae bacterium]|nr:ABC transporter ATP-binding protein [Candidatus Baltobacteraceae bacterium]